MTVDGAQVTALVRAELRLEARTGDVLRSVGPYALAAMLVVALSVDANMPVLRQIGLGTGWAVLLLFGSQAGARRGLLDSTAIREMCSVSGVSAHTVMLARMVTTLAMLGALLLVLAPITVALFDVTLVGGGWLVATTLLALIGVAALTALAGVLVPATSVRAIVAPLLVAPLSVPLLFAVVQTPSAVTYGASPLPWLLLAALIDVVVITAAMSLSPWLEGV